MHHFRFQAFRFPAILLLAAAAAGCAGRRGPGAPGSPGESLAALRAELAAIFSDPAFHNAHWGVKVQSVATGEILYEEGAGKLFMPASNIKLVTAAAALARLGPDHRFRTALLASGPLDTDGDLTDGGILSDDGILRGDLVVRGGGDPAISERFFEGDPVGAFRAWADSLEARGVHHIAGDVVGDDDFFDDVHLGPGWSWDDLGYWYAAEIGALLFNEGVVRVRVTPGDSAGAPAVLTLDPATSYLEIENRVVTVADSTDLSVRTALRPFSNSARVWGEIWLWTDSLSRYIAPHDPTGFFVTVLVETLRREGVAVDGVAVDSDSLIEEAMADSLTTVFVYESPSLAEILKPFLKRSQNQIGEMLLRYLGAAETDTGSVRTGRRVVEGMLASWGIHESYYVYVDGSGLSRYNYLSPEAVVRLLLTMARSPHFEAYYNALPVAGVDGTLEDRMKGGAAEGNARAKTGYISNARALSGYVTTADGELLAFSMIANNFDAPMRTVEYLQDLAVERLANYSVRRMPVGQ